MDKPQKAMVVYNDINQAGPEELVGKTGNRERLRKAARENEEVDRK